MVEGPCISVSQGVLFLSILLPFNAFKLCLLLSFKLIIEKAVVTLSVPS